MGHARELARDVLVVGVADELGYVAANGGAQHQPPGFELSRQHAAYAAKRQLVRCGFELGNRAFGATRPISRGVLCFEHSAIDLCLLHDSSLSRFPTRSITS